MKHVSAAYRTRAIADRVASEIEALGVPRGDLNIVPEEGSTGSATERLSTLGLDDADVRSHGEAIRDGGHVVVASVVDDEKVSTIEQIMRDPEHAMTEDELRARHGEGAAIAPAGEPLAAVGSTSNIGAADDGRTTLADPMESGEHVRHDGVRRD